jgi:methane/ammonia monooxygenase subunit C
MSIARTRHVERQHDQPARDGNTHCSKTRFSLMLFFLPAIAIGIYTVAYRVYLQVYGFRTGLDATTSTFAKHWYPILAVHLLILAPLGLLWVLRLANSGCSVCEEQREATGRVEPAHELHHIWVTLGLLLNAVIVWVFSIVMGSQDASWHQSTLRDTALTPFHMYFFYGSDIAIILLIAATFLYGRNRLPDLMGRDRIPLGFIVVIGAFLFTGIFAVTNEFGHSLWIFEERFTQPVHWPFVVAQVGFIALFPVASLLLERAHTVFLGRRGADDPRVADDIGTGWVDERV